MKQILAIVIQVSWWLGLLGILAAATIKAFELEARVHVTGHTLILVAGTFFLCVLATRAMQKSR